MWSDDTVLDRPQAMAFMPPEVVLVVEDEGTGVAPDALDRIFEPLTRSNGGVSSARNPRASVCAR